MKIILFANTYRNYELFRKDLILKLIQQKYQIILIIPNHEKINKIDDSIQILKIDLKTHNKNPFQELKTFYQIFKIYKNVMPDYTFLFTIKPNLYGSIICSLLKIKYINNITGLGTAFIRYKKIRKIFILLYKICLYNSHHVFFQNIYDLRYFRKKNIVKNKYTLIPGSGVDINYYKKDNKNETEFKNINFIFIGRLIEEKGILNYLYAANKIKQNYKDVNFYVAGSFDNENSKKINKNQINKYIENKSIIYLGFKENIKDILNNCHCIILPSYREGMSHSLLISASMSKAIITSNVPGCKDIVVDGKNGYLIKPKSNQSLIKAIIKYIKLDKKNKLSFSIFSRKLAVDKFNIQIVINNYLKLLT